MKSKNTEENCQTTNKGQIILNYHIFNARIELEREK